MPRISEFYGIVISMYRKDHNPPHFHAWYSGERAKFTISPVEVEAGSLSPRIVRLVTNWARQREAELLANWDRVETTEEFLPIPPLE